MRALRHGLENPIDADQLILEKQAEARALLRESDVSDERIGPSHRVVISESEHGTPLGDEAPVTGAVPLELMTG